MMPSTDKICGDGARYSVARLEMRDPEYALAVKSGLHWRAYKCQVRMLWPKVCGLVQSARNVGSTLNRKESEMQTLLRLHASSAKTAPGHDVPWAGIKISIMCTRPPFQEKLGAMICFAIARSGRQRQNQLQQ